MKPLEPGQAVWTKKGTLRFRPLPIDPMNHIEGENLKIALHHIRQMLEEGLIDAEQAKRMGVEQFRSLNERRLEKASKEWGEIINHIPTQP